MIKIKIYRAQDNSIKGFEVSGHAKYSKHGKDIVCSAVSVLTQTALIGLVKVAGIEADDKLEDSGYLKCEIPGELTEIARIKSSAILDTMLEGLANIKDSYKNYIDIVEEEV